MILTSFPDPKFWEFKTEIIIKSIPYFVYDLYIRIYHGKQKKLLICELSFMTLTLTSASNLHKMFAYLKNKNVLDCVKLCGLLT